MIERVRVSGDEVSDGRISQAMASRIQDAVNGYVLCNALFALVENGLSDVFRGEAMVDPAEVARQRKLDPYQLKGLFRFLQLQEVLAEEGGRYWLTQLGKNLLSVGALGMLELYRGGYGPMMTESGSLLSGAKIYGKDIVRQGKWVASGSTGFFRTFNFPAAFTAIERCKGKRVLDLGCGDASFLIDYCKRVPDGIGIGVDIDDRAVSAANAAVAQAGLKDRIRIVKDDGLNLQIVRTLASEFDGIHSFAMQHELFRDGEQKVIDHINGIAECCRGKWYVLGEPLLNQVRADSCFYWIHVLSLQGMPRSIDGWVSLFERCRVELKAVFYSGHEKTSNGGYFLLNF